MISGGDPQPTAEERHMPLLVSSLNRTAIADGVAIENERLDAVQAVGWLRNDARRLGLKLSQVVDEVIGRVKSGPRRRGQR